MCILAGCCDYSFGGYASLLFDVLNVYPAIHCVQYCQVMGESQVCELDHFFFEQFSNLFLSISLYICTAYVYVDVNCINWPIITLNDACTCINKKISIFFSRKFRRTRICLMIQKLNETTVFFLLLKNLLVSKMCFSSVKKWISVRPYLLKYYPKKKKKRKKTPQKLV